MLGGKEQEQEQDGRGRRQGQDREAKAGGRGRTGRQKQEAGAGRQLPNEKTFRDKRSAAEHTTDLFVTNPEFCFTLF